MYLEIFKELPQEKRAYMELLFRNCTEEVRYYICLLYTSSGLHPNGSYITRHPDTFQSP